MPDDTDFLVGPTPHQEAIDFIKSKPVVARQVFDQLLPDLKGRAFTIAGLEGNANVQQAIRDRLADLPAGHDWDAIKKDVANDLTPFFVDPNADPDERDAQMNAAYRRAELLLRTHGFQAYQAASYQVMDRQRDVQPFWQYLTMEDERVRPEHAALDKLILPANDPFWQTHFPPWDYGCRCQAVPISQVERDEQAAKDKKVAPDQRLVLEGPQLDRAGWEVVREGQRYDTRPPTQKEGASGFSWDPSSLRLPLDKLKARYDAPVWAEFEQWARKTDLNEFSDKTVWELAGGKAPLGRRIKRAVISLWEWMTGAAAAVFPPEPASSFDQLVARFTAVPGQMTETEAAGFIESLEKPHGVQVADKTTINISAGLDPGWKAYVEYDIQQFFKLLPEQLLAQLPNFETQVLASLPDDAVGTYNRGNRILKLSSRGLQGNAQLVSETIFHELGHWVHRHGPLDYRTRIADHFKARTAGERVAQLPRYGSGVIGKKDNFWDAYMGRVYDRILDGAEIPTMTFELLTKPAKFAQLFNDPVHRETIREALSILFS